MTLDERERGDRGDTLVRAPRFLAAFRCIGAACEDHCCGGWQGVDVDAPTLEQYRRVADPRLRLRLQLHVVDNEDPAASPMEAAFIDVARAGGCPFLSDEQQCDIQGTLGEQLLPVTCDTFPRLATRVGERIDLGARLACPEVARLVLLDAGPLQFDDGGMDRRLS